MHRPVITYRSIRARKWAGPALLAAGALLASFLYVRAKTRQVERENPPAGKFIEVDGVRLHYTELGDGPPLVLLHGNGVFADDFETSGLTSLAAERYRVIAFDRPGFGYSERPRSTVWTPQAQADLLHAALHQLGVERPLVLGHSWGTMVALSMAIQHPGYVRGLALLAGYYYPSLRVDVLLASPPAIPIIGDLLRYTLSPLLGRLMWPVITRRIFGPGPVPANFRLLPMWMMLRPSQLRASAAEGALMIPSAMKLKDHYQELDMPVTIIAGTEDRIADPGHNAGRLHEAIAHSELQLEPGVGHMVHYADPRAVLRALDGLDAQHPAPVIAEMAPAGQVLERER
ncbi:MAG: alpha/beta fold hydrolase [Telluria sp.]